MNQITSYVLPEHTGTEAAEAAPVTTSDDPRRGENQLVIEHLELARALAGRFAGRGPERDDLIQVAYLGLVKAARRYEPDRGSFASFAAPTVVGELKRHFRDRGWMVRPPRWIQELQGEIRALVDESLQGPDESLSDAAIAARLDTEVARVREARGARGCFTPRSLDTPAPETGRPAHESIADLDDPYDRIQDLVSLGSACRSLTAADRWLLSMRIVEERSQQDIADELGISQMQVSRRLKRVFDELRSVVLSGAA